MVLNVLRFVSLLLGALNLGLAWAHLVEMGPKRAMSGPDWLTAQQADRDYGKVASVTFPLAFLATLGTLVLDLRRPLPALLTAIGAACSIATVMIWVRFNQPVNQEIMTWNPDALPVNWKDRRDEWELAHAASAALHTLSLSALIGAALRKRRD